MTAPIALLSFEINMNTTIIYSTISSHTGGYLHSRTAADSTFEMARPAGHSADRWNPCGSRERCTYLRDRNTVDRTCSDKHHRNDPIRQNSLIDQSKKELITAFFRISPDILSHLDILFRILIEFLLAS